jgi:hypothetical protein
MINKNFKIISKIIIENNNRNKNREEWCQRDNSLSAGECAGGWSLV